MMDYWVPMSCLPPEPHSPSCPLVSSSPVSGLLLPPSQPRDALGESPVDLAPLC